MSSSTSFFSMHICVAWGLTYYNKFLFVCWLQTFASSLTLLHTLQLVPVTQRHEETCDDDMGTWSSDNFATINILENITWHCSGRAEIVRNHINGYAGALHTSWRWSEDLKWVFAANIPMSILTAHSHQTGGDENDAWDTGCPKKCSHVFRPKRQQIRVRWFLKSSD